MRRVHALAYLLLAIIWVQVPGSDGPTRPSDAWGPFIRSAARCRMPSSILQAAAEGATVSFGDPGEALARYSGGTVLLQESLRDAHTGALLPMEELWTKPGAVGAVYHELFHAFFERVIAANPDELERFQRRAEVVFRDVPRERRVEVAEEAVACWIASLVETALSVERRDREADLRGWPRVADWSGQDLQALANGYEVHFKPGANSFGYYQEGDGIVHTEAKMDEWLIEFAWQRVLKMELPKRFEEFLAERS